jgi:hypothetical protein
MTRSEKREAQMSESQEKALERFVGQIAEMNERLAELNAFVGDHMGYDPENIGWGHVGDAGYFLEKLSELTDCAFRRGDYAE